MIDFARPLTQVVCCLLCASLCVSLLRAEDQERTQPAGKPTAEVKAIEKSVQELAAAAKKSVVVITFTGRDGQRQGLGTGFIVSHDGLIATNLHVIGEARPIQVELFDGRKFDVASVQATERSQDLAVLKIDADDLPTLPLGNSDELQEGQAVVAIGNPMGLERSVVSGIISGRREIDGRSMLQIALPIERGNSGGPLLDLQGRVHGLLTLKSLRTENLGFAMAVNSLKPLLEKPNPIPMSRWLTIGAIDPDEWNVHPGARWRQRAGQISVDGRGGGFGGRALCLATEAPPEAPFEVAVKVRFAPSDGAAGLVFHADGGDKHYGFYPTNGMVRLTRFNGPDVYSWNVLHETRSTHLKSAGWNSLKVRVEAEKISCYLNGELVFESKDSAFKTGSVGLCKFRTTEAEFKGFQVGKSLADSRPSEELRGRIKSVVDGWTSDDSALTKASQQLLQEDALIVDQLEWEAKELESRASRIRRLAAEVHAKQTLTELKKLLKDEPLDQLRAALLIAKLDNPELDINGYAAEVERHAKHVKAAVAANGNEIDRFAALNHYLFDEQGFHGSRTDYANRSNSYINEVLDDREGLPITLSVVYIEIAKQLGLNVVGVGMPGHFLARHEPKEGPTQLVDVFDRGRLISPIEARKMYEEISESGWHDDHLKSITPPATLERMLRNLFHAAEAANEVDRMLRYTDATLTINPDSAHDHFVRGLLYFYSQRLEEAKSEVEWLNTHDSDVDRERIDKLARAIAESSPK